MLVAVFEAATLRSLCDVLADTHSGLTNKEIDRLLDELGVHDPNRAPPSKPGDLFYRIGPNKRDRLFYALAARQKRDGCGNLVAAFIGATMKPVRYADCSGCFEQRREDVNFIISFAGLQVGEDGRLRSIAPASTLREADEIARRLRRKLIDRATHPEILRFAAEEWLHKGYFHAVFEATKGLFERIRVLAGLSTDGHRLVDDALGIPSGGMPLIAVNKLATESDKTEHRGLMASLKGAYSMYRSPHGHAPRITRDIDEDDALSAFGLLSDLHRRLDAAVRMPSALT